MAVSKTHVLKIAAEVEKMELTHSDKVCWFLSLSEAIVESDHLHAKQIP